MSIETIMELVATMGGMRYFPSDPAVRLALCANPELGLGDAFK